MGCLLFQGFSLRWMNDWPFGPNRLRSDNHLLLKYEHSKDVADFPRTSRRLPAEFPQSSRRLCVGAFVMSCKMGLWTSLAELRKRSSGGSREANLAHSLTKA